MTALEIKGMKIGEGLPKTIISLMDPTVEETIETNKAGIEVGVDAFEWRGDFAADLHDPAQMATNSKLIAAATPNNPLLFTMRTIEAGGQATLPVDEYVALNKAIIEAGAIDMVDIDIELGEESTMELVAFAKEHQVATVISYHNFRGTPSVEWMVDLMCRMHNLGACLLYTSCLRLDQKYDAKPRCGLLFPTPENRGRHPYTALFLLWK